MTSCSGTYCKKSAPRRIRISNVPGGSEEGILIIWDEVNNVGKAISFTFKWPTFDLSDCRTMDAMFEKWGGSIALQR